MLTSEKGAAGTGTLAGSAPPTTIISLAKRRLLRICVVLLVLAAAVTVALVGGWMLRLDGVARRDLVRYVGSYTGTRVTLMRIRVHPMFGKARLDGLAIANPRGWSPADALYLGRVQLDFVTSTVHRDRVVLNELDIDEPRFLYESRLISSNIGDLLKAIQHAAEDSGAKLTGDNGQPVRLIVRRLRVTGGRVTVGLGPSAVTVRMGDIALDNLGEAQGGISIGELGTALFHSLIPKILTAAAGAAGEFIPATAIDAVKSAGGAVDGALTGKK
jgi:hypothetical protein